MSAVRDIARWAGAMDALRERTELLQAAVDSFPGGIALYDPSMRMVLCNDQFIEMLDYPPSLFAAGYPTMEALFRFNAGRGEYGAGDPDEHVAKRLARLRERCAHVYERTRPNGRVIEVRGAPLAVGGFVTTYFDVTERRRSQALVAHMAHHDALTDLPNRVLFADRLGQAVAQAKRGGLVALHCLDLDGFKQVNDTLGHKAGDDLLQRIAERLRRTVRDHDTVARLGGDEFAIVQTCIFSVDDAEALARRTIATLATAVPAPGAELAVGVSVGIAFAPTDGLTVDDLLMKADAALYRSKVGGRGRHTVYGCVGGERAGNASRIAAAAATKD